MVELRDYQVETASFLRSRGRAVNADEMGLGKTYSTLEAVRQVAPKRLLILSPNVAIGVWKEHVQDALGSDAVVYAGTPQKRAGIALADWSVVIAPYSMAEEVATKSSRWDVIVADEAHAYRNRQTQLFAAMKRFRSECFFPLSGSPIVRDTKDIWAQLHLIDRNKFPSYWKFVNGWYNSFKDKLGHIEVASVPIDGVGFRQMLRQYCIRHTKQEVAAELPEKIRRRIPLEMTKAQAAFYNDLADDMMAEYGNRLIITPTVVAQITRLRQCLVNPALIGGPDESTVLEALQEAMAGEFDLDRPTAVFCPYKQAIPYLEATAKKAGAKHIGIIQGGMPWAKIQKVIKEFQEHPDPRKTLLCSLLASTSWTATAAKSAYFVGFDWTPMVNWQAEDRLHRIGQTDSVEASYFVHEGTVDENVWEVLCNKKMWGSTAWETNGMLRPGR